ncbi:histidine kinase [Candidatus Sulfidibacterium hydrothermale]|uniref:sensor histidine kinase n=1 Tax=Candidatus Sulfidibacterium hydrothermale TaxID=2875962 RepID=UPI001F0AA242|nr:histidine kinase [Candidatus Sulfidibacterium hydrothermale]UBM61589.1 histidine kinase [Candidatus Sulfidibacterium hydrothermale]
MGDYDGNGKKEIYIFATSHDSIFLHVEEPLNHDKIIINRMFITTIGVNTHKQPSYGIKINGLEKMSNQASFKSLIFTINGFFDYNTRFSAQIDIKNKRIIKTEGLHFPPYISAICDVDNDGRKEAFIWGEVPSNTFDTVPFSDSKAWFMILNNKMKFKYPPISFPSHYGISFSFPVGSPGNYKIYFFYSKTRNSLSTLYLYDTSKHQLKDTHIKLKVSAKSLIKTGQNRTLIIRTKKRKFYLLSETGKLKKLPNCPSIVFPYTKRSFLCTFRGKQSYFFPTKNPLGYMLLNDHFEKLAFLKLNNSFNYHYHITFWRIMHGKKVQLLVYNDDKPFLFNISRNPYYYIWPLIYLAVFGFFLAFVYAISYSQKQRLKKKEELEKRILSLQLITLKGQIRPHFIFNALNAIMANINLGQYDLAYKYLGKFSRLLRMLYAEENKLVVSLHREMDFVRNYLEIEHFRFKENLIFSITIDDDINQDILIPRMLIQIFVENAIKHGIKNLNKPGKINIHIYQDKKSIIIEIEDNGIGRKAAAKKPANQKSGYGLKVVNDMIAIHKKQTGIQVNYHYIDLYSPDGKAEGTKVVVQILKQRHKRQKK